MKITFELSKQVEAKLRETLARRDAEEAKRLLAEAVAPTVEALLHNEKITLSETEFEALADQLADELSACVGPDFVGLSDEAVSRAGIYQDHP
jgi:hypothetical protein